MVNNVISIANASEDGKRWDAEQMLMDALELVRSGERGRKKALILFVDDDDDDAYMPGFSQCGLTMAECVTLCEFGKDRFKYEMAMGG